MEQRRTSPEKEDRVGVWTSIDVRGVGTFGTKRESEQSCRSFKNETLRVHLTYFQEHKVGSSLQPHLKKGMNCSPKTIETQDNSLNPAHMVDLVGSKECYHFLTINDSVTKEYE